MSGSNYFDFVENFSNEKFKSKNNSKILPKNVFLNSNKNWRKELKIKPIKRFFCPYL